MAVKIECHFFFKEMKHLTHRQQSAPACRRLKTKEHDNKKKDRCHH